MFIWLTMALSRPFKADYLALPLSVPLSPPGSTVVSQHFISFETQATYDGCFALQSICSVISIHSGMSRAVHLQEFSKVDADHWHIPVWASQISIFSFCSKIIDSLRMMACVVWLSHLEAIQYMGDCSHLHRQAGGWDCIGCIVFVDGSRTLPDTVTVKPHPDWSFTLCDWTISVHQEILQSAVFLNEKLDLWFHFACWPFSTVLSQVFWQECLFGYLSHSLVLLELCQLAYLQHWVLCLTHPSLHPFVSFTASWSGLWGFLMAVKYALTCSTSSLDQPKSLENGSFIQL